MPEVDYKVTVDTTEAEKSLKALNGRFEQLAKSADNALGNTQKKATNTGSVISGAIGGVFTTLSAEALQFGKATVSAFADVIASSTQAAIEFDNTRRKFISIFEGREDEADAVMDRIGQRASTLGLDLNEALSISRSFIPDLKGAEDPIKSLDDLLLSVRGLTEEDPSQGITGVRIALDEALSGSLSSLQKRFEFSQTELGLIKESQKELGDVAGAIEGINKVLARKGFDIEATKGTVTQSLGEIGFAVGKLQIKLGEPIADKLSESLTDLNKIIIDNSDDLELLAASVGDVVANVVDFISTDVVAFLQQVDPSKVMEVVQAFDRLVNQIRIINELLAGTKIEGTFLEDVTAIIDKITEAIEVFTKLDSIIDILGESGRGLGGAIRDSFGAEGETFGERFTNSLIGILKTNEEAKESFLASADAIGKGNELIKEQEDRLKERKAAQEAGTEAGLASAEAFLKEGDAAQQASAALAELGVSEEDLQKIQDDAAKTLQKRLDLEKKFSQERADIQTKSLQDIEDIERDHQREIEDAGRDLNRSSRDLAQKQSKERSEAEKDLRRELIDVEIEFQRELDRISRQTKQSLESAELKQDALAFVEALREQEIAQEEAKITRDEAEADVRLGSEQRLTDLEESQAAERAALQQSFSDKLLDLQINLQREFEEQQLSDQRRDEQQAISEQRRLEKLAEGQAQRLAAVTEGLSAEVVAVIEAEAAKLSAVESFAASATAALTKMAAAASIPSGPGQSPGQRAARERLARIDAGEETVGGRDQTNLTSLRRRLDLTKSEVAFIRESGDVTGAISEILAKRRSSNVRRLGGKVTAGFPYRVGEVGIEGYLPHRQFGGPALGGQAMVVGELGEELFVPPASGNIIPNNQMGAFLDQRPVDNSTNSEVNFQPTFELSNPAVLSPAQAAATRSIASAVASDLFRQVLGGRT